MEKARREQNYPPSYKPLFKEIHAMLNDIQRGERISRRTFQVEGGNGLRDVEGTVLPVGSTGSAITGRLIVLRDVSEEKSVERFREELTHMIVHDLRSPLSGVISSLRLIEDMVATNDMDDFQQVLNIALTSSENQMRMIESMLEIDKLEKGERPLQIEVGPVDRVGPKAIAR